MGVGLKPLEFTDCLTDSPYFRENLHYHERELEKTSQQIKRLVKEVKDLLLATRNLSRAQRTFSKTLQNFSFECIGESQTEDETHISQSLKEFGKLIASIEDERDRMLERAYDQIILPLENFRKDHIGGVKDGKKKFEKQTIKFCQSQERYLNLSTKKQDNVLQEADATLEMAERHFSQASLEYVFLLQEVQERKKFEFVETLLGFMFGWLTFYHQGHEVAKDFKPYMTELQLKIQKTRENFLATRDKTESLMNKMKDMKKSAVESGLNKLHSREGYLFLMEKKAFGTTWTKQYCTYQKDRKEFTMIPYNQLTGKFSSKETFTLASCIRRTSDTIEKRFCFDITAIDRPNVTYTFQALSEEDRKLWMDAMDGKEPTFSPRIGSSARPEDLTLAESGFTFVSKCIAALEDRGLEEQGLYRVVGVASKVSKLLTMGLDKRKVDKLNLSDRFEWESKTITSALKTYLRTLSEPLMTFRYYNSFITAAKQEMKEIRINDIHSLVYRLPKVNFNMVILLITHLSNVAKKSDKNLMTVGNLAVCFGPTLLRPEEETVASIMDIKFYNIVVEILIENCERIVTGPPQDSLRAVAAQSTLQATVIPSKAQCVKVEEGPTSSGNGTAFLRYPLHTAVTVTPASSHAHLVTRAYYDGQPLTVNKSPTIDERNNGDYEDLDSTSHRIPSYLDSRGGGTSGSASRIKLTNANLMYHSADKGLVLSGGNTSSSSESIASDPHPFTSELPMKHKRGTMITVHYPTAYPQRSNSSSICPINTSPSSGRSSPGQIPGIWRVRTLYACMAENDGELSFEPNQIITNVKASLEPGWLEGTLNGKTGLVPKNYVEQLP